MSNNGIPAQADTMESVESLKAQLETAQKEALAAEERRRNTQSSYTKGQQRIKALEAEIAILREEASKAVGLKIASNDALEELKHTDPEAWYRERLKLENQHMQDFQSRINEESKKATQAEMLTQRMQYLEDFNKANPDANLTDEFLSLDIPQRLRVELEQTGDFESFVNKAYEWKRSGKVVGSSVSAPASQPNLGNIGGANAPSKDAKLNDVEALFKNMRF